MALSQRLTRVGNYDQAIRVPERLYERIERRQAKTVSRFVQRLRPGSGRR
ncbi:hypothetical protein ACFV7R_40335 [Streptomyces sp. NPDC059866]